MISPLNQTSSLEGFHSVLNHFSPKMLESKSSEFSDVELSSESDPEVNIAPKHRETFMVMRIELT